MADRTTSRVASQADVSETNRSRILTHLHRHGVCSRAQIAKALGLTPAAVTKITARLIEAGVIRETGAPGGRNRRAIGLELAADAFHVIGVKFARSLVQVGVFDLNGTRLALETLPPVTDETVPRTVGEVRRTVAGLIERDPRIVAVGMAVPGPYLREVGRTALVSTMQGWRTVNFLDEFSGAFPAPVFIEQDARAGALAQTLFGASPAVATVTTATAADDTCLAYYLLGEGVGLGVVDHGRLVNGAQGTATEVGHISIDVNGRPCDCGNRGCLERYCSTPAIHAMVDDAGIVEGSAAMSHAQACRALFALAQEGDARARGLVREVGHAVGYGLVIIANAFNPSRIVIGDIVAEAGPLLLEAAREVMDERVIAEVTQATEVTASALPTDAAVLGAGAIAITRFLERPSAFLDLT
ncbi:ROK family transcriptional regulator [Bifidobacterium pullorum subsp. saeculare]|uniref:ROK family transcriptional regulator n=1 Tax=Bifidobacterium pullorum subsp. saeculare TaxID=78257 RepID=A0A938WYL7_9BIFI|nr:ROK family transcriptional regulator [Bifidobacterium pullorum]MBM6700306.1 ROK family transcriptional regulator [Bifidobacterium pullorum subsp. saeculare]